MNDETEEMEHTDGEDCWCHPDLIFVADNGNEVWVHHGNGEELPPAHFVAEAIAMAIAIEVD